MNYVEESASPAPHASTSSSGNNNSVGSLVQDALGANKHLQRILVERAEQLEAKLKEADRLLTAATVEESQDEPESEISIPGAKKAVGLFPSAEFLNPASPFYEEATKRSNYINNITPHSLKPKDIEVLSAAVTQENERLRAYNTSHLEDRILSQGPIDLQNNVEGLDWGKIAEKVSDASSVKRTAGECRIAWVADKHPTVNHAEWSEDELNSLNTLISQYTKEKKGVDWVDVAEKLGTNRTPIACMKHGIPRHRHNWSQEADQKLLHAVESYGHDNWQLVARKVSEHVSAGQCQNRWQKTLNPMLRKGAWTDEEDERLRNSVAGYGSSWIQVATAIPGRTNDQCRERWMEHLNNASVKAVWTPEEDKMLLDLVQELGNQWKLICLKIGGNKTGQNCRLRFDRLKRLERNSQTNPSSSSLAAIVNSGPSLSIVHDTSTPQDTPRMSPSTNIHEFSSHPDTELLIPIITPRSKSRAKGEGKGDEKTTSADSQHTSGPSQPDAGDGGGGPALNSMDVVEDGIVPVNIPVASPSKDSRKPKPRPRPRPKGSIKGKSDILPESIASENHIDLNGLVASEIPGPVEGMADPRPNKVSAPSTRAKRKTTDAPDILEVPKSKRTKGSKIADPKPSLSFTNLAVSAVTDPELQQTALPKQRGRPRKAKPSLAAETETEQIAQATPMASTVDSDVPMTRTRRQSSRLQNSLKPSS